MKRFFRFGYPLLLILFVVLFFTPFLIHGKLPIPADTIIGLYHPFRDLYSADYPNGIPYKNYLITDPVRQQYPWRQLAVEQMRSGQLPLWNAYSFAGTPLLGSFQSAAFNPLNLFFFILPFSLSWSLLILLQPLLAGLFMYWYLRNLRLQRIACFVGSVAFSCSGSMIAWLEWGTLGYVILWLPLLLLSIDNIFSLSSRGVRHKANDVAISKRLLRLLRPRNDVLLWSFIFLFSLMSSFFAGHLQIFFYIYLFSFTYFFIRWLQNGKSKRKFLVFLILNSLFMILTSIQWFPTVQFILQSAREIDQMNWQEIEGWFIPWQHLIQFIAPDFFGNPTTLNYWGTWNYGELVGYVGMMPLLFAFFALFFRYDKKTFFVGAIFFLSLLFALPTFFAQLPFLLHLPFLSTSQPTRLLVLTDFCLAILAALGIDYFLQTAHKRKIFSVMGFFAFLFGCLWFFVVGGQSLFPGVQAESIATAKRNLLFPTIIFGVSSVLLVSVAFFFKRVRVRNGILIILLLLTVVDLLRFAQKFTPFTEQAYLFPQTNMIAYLQEQPGQFRIMTTDDRILPPNFSSVYKLQSLDGYDPLYLRRYGELMAAIGRDKPDIAPPFGFNRIITPHTVDSRLIDLLGVRYILSLSALPEKRFIKRMTEGKTILYENPRAFPRAFFVTTVLPVQSKEEAITALFDKEQNLRNTAIVEGWDRKEKDFSSGKVTIASYASHEVILQTQLTKEGFLVFIDSWYPSWKTKICSKEKNTCKEVPIYRTDYHFRGIVVPPGEKSIIFYQSLL